VSPQQRKRIIKKLDAARSIVIRLVFVALFFLVLVSVIAYARGYRLDPRNKSITPTGILATSSAPKAAKVYINGALKGVTDLNLTLPPGEYTVEMKKEGYTDWKKTIKLQGEIVMSLEGLLFPKNPSLSPLTNLGLSKVIPVGQTERLILISENDDILQDGLYIFEANSRPLSLLPPLKRLFLKSVLPVGTVLKDAAVTFSHDYQQAIFEFVLNDAPVAYLVPLNDDDVQPFDVTTSKDAVLAVWQEEKNEEVRTILEALPKQLVKIASDSMKLVAVSPDETKIMYQATEEITLPRIINPPLIGANQTLEQRTIQPDKLYVYDRKEDKNFEIKDVNTPPEEEDAAEEEQAEELLNADPLQSVVWYPDSRHFIIKGQREIVVIDYDGDNKRTIYSGPFEKSFFSITPDGRLLILTNLNPQFNQSPDLYAVGIR
jgi:hypothetical protein